MKVIAIPFLVAFVGLVMAVACRKWMNAPVIGLISVAWFMSVTVAVNLGFKEGREVGRNEMDEK